MNLSRAAIERRAARRLRPGDRAADRAGDREMGPRDGFGACPAGTACGALRWIVALWFTAQAPSYACLGSV
jgi:hypothetical protein